MSQLGWAVRIGGFGMLTRLSSQLGSQLGSQHVARRNAAMAAAALLRHREEREAVDAYVASRLDAQLRPATPAPPRRPAAGAGTAS